ncbi:putative RNA-directed DNA polymerase from mobile element jockey-like [Apostichopus japonicus]|uniref:Putative RNA-directed DNA polymerase from mobile element jockey-like n=1 Tax=Stichopus japonicus TaxID=307972 RepID=A0A2G8JR57_STIJA|nr:putative RNA-directed DNA polymerase from mobile element jockey-like [Apostichopus japonicus]
MYVFIYVQYVCILDPPASRNSRRSLIGLSKPQADRSQSLTFIFNVHGHGLTLPPDKDSKDLVHEFSIFFIDKITRIRASIVSEGKSKSFSLTVHKPPSCALDMWEPATEDELKRIIMASPSKSCGLDPLPTNLLKQCVTPLLPVISTIVNNSLITGDVPSAFKLAHVTPLIKKPSLDPTVLSNYRPVSNLPFVSKILEKVVSSRLTSYFEHSGLQETHQSAYRKKTQHRDCPRAHSERCDGSSWRSESVPDGSVRPFGRF